MLTHRSQPWTRGYHGILLKSILLLLILALIPYALARWDPYDIIGVRRDASLDQIKKAYREMAKRLHPDKSSLSKEESERKFMELNRAFTILKDPRKRRRFDSQGIVEAPSLIERILLRFIDFILRLIYYFVSMESFSTVIVLSICALITSIYLYQTPASARVQPPIPTSNEDSPKNDRNRTCPENRSSRVDDLKIIELKAETYYGMIRLSRPGCRTIVLLCDQATKELLLTQFKRAVWQYRLNKTLLFGYLCLDKNLDWYKSLLQDATGVDDLRVNKKNCVGTVLSINGFKRNFRIYHTKHHEVDSYDNEASFLGFEDSDELDIEPGYSSVKTTDESTCEAKDLLARLPIWLDKMFDGLTKRYSVDEWPELIK